MEKLISSIASGELKNVAMIVAIASICFEVAPIKVNPVASVLRWIGKKMFEPFVSRLDSLERSIDENEMDRIRWEVLGFANRCRNGNRHTKEEFDHVISQNDKYHKLLAKYELENGVFDAEYAYILRLYKNCQDENDFL